MPHLQYFDFHKICLPYVNMIRVQLCLYPWAKQIAETEKLGEVELDGDRESIGFPHQARSNFQAHIDYGLNGGYGHLSSRS
jgi:hypothetical protein